MPYFLELCERYYATKDLYEVLQIDKKADINNVKRAYKKLSLLVHPDRVIEEEKQNATEKFKILGKVYSILSDEDKRKEYDCTGCVDDDDSGDSSEKDWSQYWRSIFKNITSNDIAAYESKYKNSEEELDDLLAAYRNGKGCMDYILDYVPFSSPDDEERLRKIIERQIGSGDLPSYEAFTNEAPLKAKARKRKWLKEAKQAEKLEKNILKKKNKNDGEEMDPFKAIMQRRNEREANTDALFKHLENKYCKPRVVKGRKGTK